MGDSYEGRGNLPFETETMTQIVISGGKTVTIREFKTRKIARGYEDRLFKGVSVTPGMPLEFNASNANDANDYLVAEMAGLTEEEVGELAESDYKEILDAIQALDKKDDATP